MLPLSFLVSSRSREVPTLPCTQSNRGPFGNMRASGEGKRDSPWPLNEHKEHDSVPDQRRIKGFSVIKNTSVLQNGVW